MGKEHRFSGGFKNPFSNVYKAECEYEGLVYRNSEAAFQAAKVLDDETRKKFQNLNPSEAKRLGRNVTLRKDWEEVKYQVMLDVLHSKFQDTTLRNLLLGTGDDLLIEDTTGWHDNIWGDCLCPKCESITGKNLLGKALMEVRASLRQQKEMR